MSAATRAARIWLDTEGVHGGARISVVDIEGGLAAAATTGISHIVVDAAEVTVDNETTLAAAWLCGSSSINAIRVDGDQAQCLSCRLTAALPQDPCVYFAWGADDELLYVGSTINAVARVRHHAARTPWWPHVRRLTFETHEREDQARHAEYRHIRATPGLHNKGGRADNVVDHSLLRLLGGEGA